MLKDTKNSWRDIFAGSPSIHEKIASMNLSLTEQEKNKCNGVSFSTSGFLMISQKVQFGEWPGTKCATALLYPAVLLCNLKRNVRVAFEKTALFQRPFKIFDCSKLITVSVLSLYLTML